MNDKVQEILGLVKEKRCALTNLGWHLEQESLRASIGLDSLELINDICVLLYGIPFLKQNLSNLSLFLAKII